MIECKGKIDDKLSTVASLQPVEILSLYECKQSDFKSLGKFEILRELWLEQGTEWDLSLLHQLPNLVKLTVVDAIITDDEFALLEMAIPDIVTIRAGRKNSRIIDNRRESSPPNIVELEMASQMKRPIRRHDIEFRREVFWIGHD